LPTDDGVDGVDALERPDSSLELDDATIVVAADHVTAV
jgi:hypothetical protein